MKIKLYDKFSSWYNKGNIFLISDPHFDDIDLSYRNITSLEITKKINNVVGKYDTIIFLGDIGNIDYIKHIKGYKVLIKGNHDAGNSLYLKSNNNNLFDEIYDGPLFISDKILLSHEPIELSFAINIHGHDHKNTSRPNCINVCAEHINYTPIALDKLVSTVKVDNIHRHTIDKAIERKLNNTIL